MKKIILFVFLFLSNGTLTAQAGFLFKKDVNKVGIPFQLINNLVFIPLVVNGVELTFLLDSGVEETILFSLEDTKGLDLKNKETVSLVGLGSKEKIEGLKSTGNLLETKGMISRNHLLYVILDQDFNLSSHVGIPVNGIIGYSFLKNNLIEINYQKRKIFFYKETAKRRKRINRKFTKVPITIEGAKPYVYSNVVLENYKIPVKLLVDIGNSDAVWLFQHKLATIELPPKNFEDYLGQGFSGEVIGKRAKIKAFEMAGFQFENPITAFPDSVSTKHVKMVPDRLGSVGGEIFKRFTVVLDYKNEALFLKKNRSYSAPFTYNKSGVEIKHIGMQWVKETVHLKLEPKITEYKEIAIQEKKTDFQYKFKLKPVYVISNIRRKSAAEICGLQEGDILIKINEKLTHRFSLQELSRFLKSEEEKWISLEVERNSQLLKFSFQLKNLL